jgi:hypothetical protein
MKNFIYISICLAVVLCIRCNNNKVATAESTEKNVIDAICNTVVENSKENEIKRIELFSKCTNYDNKLSTVASEVQFIPLDDDPLINEFHTNDIAVTDDFILLAGLHHIYQYDKKGKYIRNIGSRGMGPTEYVNICPPLQTDNEAKLIYVLDSNRRRIVVYRFDGTFERAFPVDFDGSMAILDSVTIAFSQTMVDRFLPRAPFLSFTDRYGKNKKIYFSHLHPVMSMKEAQSQGSDVSFLWEHTKRFYYLEYGADTIFRISRDTLAPAWILAGKLKPEKKELFLRNAGEKLKNVSAILRPNSGIFESNKFLIFKLSDNKECFYMIYDKTSQNLHRTYDKNAPVIKNPRSEMKNMNYFIDDIVSGLHFSPEYQSMGKAIALIPAVKIIENRDKILQHIDAHPSREGTQLRMIVESMDEFDNPLVMLVTFQ